MKPLAKNDDYLFLRELSTFVFQVIKKDDKIISPLVDGEIVLDVSCKDSSAHGDLPH
jgi:hypothetical protein